MLSNWGKVLEEVILSKMKNSDGEIKGVPPNQFAYRPGHSAVHAVDLHCAETRENRKRGRTTAVVSLDVTKAFDSVWRKGLVFKLRENKEHSNIVAMINSFMLDRRAVVRLGDTDSNEFHLGRGNSTGIETGTPSVQYLHG